MRLRPNGGVGDGTPRASLSGAFGDILMEPTFELISDWLWALGA